MSRLPFNWPSTRPAILIALSAAAGMPAVAQEIVTWQDPASWIEFVRIQAGCFEMGEQKAAVAGPGNPFPVPMPDEVPRHRACVGEFWIARTETTRDQWQRIMNPAVTEVMRPSQAVTDISWNDAQRFVGALTRMERPADKWKRRFRLPTEAEWEYACHAGDRRPANQLHGEEAGAMQRWAVEHAWYEYPRERDRWAHDVGLKRSNAWGLYDMLGNVLEWVEDSYSPDGYPLTGQNPAQVSPRGALKAARGGSYRSPRERIRCGARFSAYAEDAIPVMGVRVVMVIEANQ